ncbi:hypothetical protein SKAU_G00256780 [Synaphobranchus kaupii]|uniref:Uncharacterized protein n=1 Tax=Synaphobranchus kaupii TaxID=118154 RepID=A0A9Q1F3W5_SYNKA|nr:hypothetical protein SKAU_G00256780 [Synaphobranchus kaupii]
MVQQVFADLKMVRKDKKFCVGLSATAWDFNATVPSGAMENELTPAVVNRRRATEYTGKGFPLIETTDVRLQHSAGLLHIQALRGKGGAELLRQFRERLLFSQLIPIAWRRVPTAGPAASCEVFSASSRFQCVGQSQDSWTVKLTQP